jgi:hypothetical protein
VVLRNGYEPPDALYRSTEMTILIEAREDLWDFIQFR